MLIHVYAHQNFCINSTPKVLIRSSLIRFACIGVAPPMQAKWIKLNLGFDQFMPPTLLAICRRATVFSYIFSMVAFSLLSPLYEMDNII